MGEDYFEDLREQGFDEDFVAGERLEVERLLERRWIEPENWTAAQVFLQCHWDRSFIAGLSKVKELFLGITSSEVLAVCRAQRVPRDEWPEVLASVRIMASAALKKLNAEKD